MIGAPGVTKMGYQRGLDGLRAVSVIAVMFYHAGFGWMRGGFFGVEVFFVVSGYLITSLLLDERESSGRVRLGQFWLRRARRLLPALFAMLIAVAVWAKFWASAEQQSTLRRDLPWAIAYLGNWGQILGKAAYFSPVDPPLLRHLWSLAVEEQWYLLWPLVFVGVFLLGREGGLRIRGALFIGSAAAVMGLTFWLHSRGSITPNVSVLGRSADRTNFLYLGTLTRSSGLLLGAGAAFLWRPWRSAPRSLQRGRFLDPLGACAVAGLTCAMSVSVLTDGYVYQWLLAVVSLLSMIAIAVVVHPEATAMRRVFGSRVLVETGKRSYGLYLWHWPIFVIGKVYHTGSWSKFLLAMGITVLISEFCYQYIETPIRRGALGRWLTHLRTVDADPARRTQDRRLTFAATVTVAAGLALLTSFYVNVRHFDAAAGGADVAFSVPGDIVLGAGPTVTTAAPTGGISSMPGQPIGVTTTTAVATTTTLPTLPRRLVVVGDSQAHALVVNMPTGIESIFTVEDGSVEGCGVYEAGRAISVVQGYSRTFSKCVGWAAKWGAAAQRSNAEVALVVLGAWDVFDVQLPDRLLTFGTPETDAYYLAELQRGIDALRVFKAQVALLEIPCMRPVEVAGGGGVPALPERGDDARVAHLNDLLRHAAAADPEHVFFVSGPTEWCADPAIATNLSYRWDGVHYFTPGANLVMTAITPSLLRIPVAPR